MENKSTIQIQQRIQKEFPDLYKKLDRLKGITGFISILGSDPRVAVFCRYNHIRRVTGITSCLLELYPDRDPFKAIFLSLFHDINRLPFAHNLEKKIGFKQDENLWDYFKNSKDEVPDDFIYDLESILQKKILASPEAVLVYTADVVAGFIEDPILALSTLGLQKDSINAQIMEILGFDSDVDAFYSQISHLNQLYNTDGALFSTTLGEVALQYAASFIERFSAKNKLLVETDSFQEMRNKVKSGLLQNIIFPVNNEKVSKGSRLASEIAIPYMAYLKSHGFDPIEKLLEMTDQEVLDQAVTLGLVPLNPKEYWPDL